MPETCEVDGKNGRHGSKSHDPDRLGLGIEEGYDI